MPLEPAEWTSPLAFNTTGFWRKPHMRKRIGVVAGRTGKKSSAASRGIAAKECFDDTTNSIRSQRAMPIHDPNR